MRNGARRNKIEIQQKTSSSRDELNQPIVAWTTFSEAFAEIVAKSGQEFYDQESKQRFQQVKYRFRCNYFDANGVNETMRIAFDGQLYDIRAVLPDIQCKDDIIIEATLQAPSQ